MERVILAMAPFRSLLLALALGLACAGCSQKKSDPLEAAKLFFQQVSSGQAQVAYQNAAFGFQAQRTATVFEAAAKEMGLVESPGAEFEPPQIEGRTAKIRARVQTKEGKTLPLIVTLTRESTKWQVYSLKSPPSEETGISENRFTLVGKAPAFTDAATQPVPPETDLRKLVKENLLRFNEAIASKSFDAFYESVSLKWQDQLTKGQLQRAFQPFIDKHIDLSAIDKADPIWDSPVSVGTDGLMVLSGYYPTEPYRVHFSLKFLYELPTWKLFGIDVNLRK
jgi:hypothetical protein